MTFQHHTQIPLNEYGSQPDSIPSGFSIGSITRHDQGHHYFGRHGALRNGRTPKPASSSSIVEVAPLVTSHLRQGLRHESQWLLSKIALNAPKRPAANKGKSNS